MESLSLNNPPMKNDTNNLFRGDVIDLTDDTEPQPKVQTVVSSNSNLGSSPNKKICILENTLLNPSPVTGLPSRVSPSLLLSGNEKNTSSTSWETEDDEMLTKDVNSPFVKTYTGRKGSKTWRNLPNLYLTTADGLPLPSQEIIVGDDIDNDDVVLVEEPKIEKPPPAPKPPPTPTGLVNKVNQTPNITPVRSTLNTNMVNTQIKTANLTPNRPVKPVETPMVKGIVSPKLPLKKLPASNSNVMVNRAPNPLNFGPVKSVEIPMVKGIVSPNLPFKKTTASNFNMIVNRESNSSNFRLVKPVETPIVKGIVSPKLPLKKLPTSNSNVITSSPNPLNFGPVKPVETPIVKGIVSPKLPLKKLPTSNSNVMIKSSPNPLNFGPIEPMETPMVKGIVSPNLPLKKFPTSNSNMMVKGIVSSNLLLKKFPTSNSNMMVNSAPNPHNFGPLKPVETSTVKEIVKKIRVIPHFPLKNNPATSNSNLMINSAPNFKARILSRNKPKPPVKTFNPVETLAEIVETATAVANIESQKNETQPNQPIIYLLYPLQNSSDVLVASNDPNHVEETPMEEAQSPPRMTKDLEIEPPCVVTPVDITKILNRGKKIDLMSRCEEAPLKHDQRDFLGFTRRERRKTACCSFYKTLLKIDRKTIKTLKKSISKLTNYQKNIIYCACPSDNFLPETIKEELSPECIKIEDEECDPLEDQIHDVIYNTDALPSISEVISQVNEEVRQIKEKEATIQKNNLQAKLAKPEQALKLIKEGLELIQSWSKETNSSVNVEEVLKKRKGRRKSKIDEEVPKFQSVVPVSDVIRKKRVRQNKNIEELKNVQKRKKRNVFVSDIRRKSIRLDGELPKKRGRKKKVVEVRDDDDLLVVKRIDIIKQSGVVKSARRRKT